jgi:hypothetical protein
MDLQIAGQTVILAGLLDCSRSDGIRPVENCGWGRAGLLKYAKLIPEAIFWW